jgi:hypothetical protein
MPKTDREATRWSVKPWNEITRQKPFFKRVAVAVLAEEPNTMQEKPPPQLQPNHNTTVTRIQLFVEQDLIDTSLHLNYSVPRKNEHRRE